MPTPTLDRTQHLILLRLAVSEGGAFLKDLEGGASVTRRRRLVQAGLIETSKRRSPSTARPAIYLELTDRGWAWCSAHLGDPIGQGSPALVAGVLSGTLALLARFIERQPHTHSLGHLVLQAGPPACAAPPEGLDAQIGAACLALAGGQPKVRIRLVHLRARLPAIAREVLDRALLDLERDGVLVLYPLDDPREIGPDDRAAALYTPSGNARHIVYFGSAS